MFVVGEHRDAALFHLGGQVVAGGRECVVAVLGRADGGEDVVARLLRPGFALDVLGVCHAEDEAGKQTTEDEPRPDAGPGRAGMAGGAVARRAGVPGIEMVLEQRFQQRRDGVAADLLPVAVHPVAGPPDTGTARAVCTACSR